MPNQRTKDRRVERTRGLLRGALASLIHEKPYDRIVVKEILARANVGRSTFYAHFRDKDELLHSGIAEILRASAPATAAARSDPHETILWFSRPVFEHIERQLNVPASRVKPNGQAIVHEHLERVLVALIATRLKQADRRHLMKERDVPLGLLAEYVASTFVLVLNWWVESEDRLPVSDVNDLFRRLVLPTPRV
ncbi:MAG TPA: TetR/AcrR family transcriptional regulator [Gemmatimonadaceae bacterium]|nr:TetR/AcrR family transcriptional regulator [Gemmatimonadaceae bacterium]